MYALCIILGFSKLTYAAKAPTSPRVSSPLARSVSVPANHPHARKASVFDGQVQIQSPIPSSLVSNASTSTFSLTLDPIAEGTTSPMPPETPATLSPFTERLHLPPQLTASASVPMELSSGLAFRHTDMPQQKSQVGLGRGPPPIALQPPSSRASSSHFTGTNTELILYSYAQLSGTLSISPLGDIPLTAEQTQTLQAMRRNLLNAKAVGGGSLDIISHSPQSLAPGTQLSSSARHTNHARSTSLSSGLLSLLSPASTVPALSTTQQPTRAQHHRSSSVFSSLFPGSANSTNITGLGLGATDQEEGVDADTPLPTYQVQPTMLAIDLPLSPGESRSCTLNQLFGNLKVAPNRE